MDFTYCTESSGEDFNFECYEEKFSVTFDYPVYFTKNLFHPENSLLESVIDRHKENCTHRLKVFIDSGVVDAVPGIVERIASYIEKRSVQLKGEGDIEIVPGGEQSKNGWSVTQNIMSSIAKSHLCRKSFVLAIGGGGVLDSVGLASSLVHRGLRLVRIPTTVLSQNDAGVGVKNGINESGVKNFAGTFLPPFAVLVDYDFLKSVPYEYWIGGVAEAFKVAIIKDRIFFGFLCENAARLKERSETVIEETVKRCAVLHLEHIAGGNDPFETGTARPLDFGHWCAHRLETMSGYSLHHGNAVSVGISLDSAYACEIGLLSVKERDSIITALEDTGLPIWNDFFEKQTGDGRLEILQGLYEFQEHLGGRLSITMPKGIGCKVEIDEMDPVIIKKAVDFLRHRARAKAGKSVTMDKPVLSGSEI